MRESELRLLHSLRTISRYSILFGIIISIALTRLGSFPLEVQVTLALIALTIGIPHGAVDHLTTVPKLTGMKMALFLTGYLAVVALAVAFILSNNTLGFQIVVLMSAIHFGIGDAAFVSEIDRRESASKSLPKISFAIASGFTPVVIPLVNSQSTQALERVKPSLVNWVGDLAPVFFYSMIGLSISAVLLMVFRKKWQEVIDLALLLTLALVAPPLVAFAFYFGLWHALRHTGRLTLEIPSAHKMHSQSKPSKAFAKAFLAGIPALAITLLGTVFLGLTRGFEFSQEFLWYLLVVVWALTVPHMALTARLDYKALR